MNLEQTGNFANLSNNNDNIKVNMLYFFTIIL